jgi:hypothetical protein
MTSQMTEKELIELKEIIEKSIFSDDKKKELLLMIDSGQVSDDIFKKIENYFSDYLKEKQGEYQNEISKMDEGFKEIDEVIESEKKELEKALERELLDVDVWDTKRRVEIWKKYYQDLNELNREHEKKTIAFSSSMLVAMI